MKTLDPCPGAEVIAACVEGRLPADARKQVLQHLLVCEDCYTVFSETAQFVDHGAGSVRRRPWAAYIAAAAAVMAVGLLASIGGAWWVQHRVATPASLMNRLTKAIGTERPSEGRLSIPLAYGPPGVFKRSADGTRPLGARALEVTAIAARIEELASKEPSAEALHALGLAQLTIGDLDAAVGSLDRALIKASRDARLLSDLGAALLERGVRQDRPQDTARALSLIEEALEIEPGLPEARFNRALALESLDLRQRALQAWEAYLEVDSLSAWADEARRRIEILRQPTETELWPSSRKQLEAAALAGQETTVREIVDRYRQASREWLVFHWLGRWGSHVSSGDREAATRTLHAAEVLARAHSELTGDPMSRDIVEVVVAASSQSPVSPQAQTLAKAHEALVKGWERVEALRAEKAVPYLEAAQAGFRQARSPAGLWAAQNLARTDVYRRRYEAAVRRLDATRVEAELHGYLALQGHVHALRGLIHAKQARWSQAQTEYRQSISAFEQVQDAGYTTFATALIAENLGTLADRTEEWHQWQKALNGLAKYIPDQKAEVVLMAAAVASLEQRLPRTALQIQEECLDSCRRHADPVQLANALQWRALAHYRVGHGAAAMEDLRQARSWSAKIEDADLRARLKSELDYAEGLASTLGDAGLAHKMLTESLEYFRSAGDDVREAELCLARGRVSLRQNNVRAAGDDFLAGIQAFESQRLTVVPGDQRISFFDTATDLFDEAVGVEVRQGRVDEALTLAERARARQLLETLSSRSAPATASEIAAGLPDGTALLLYQALPERLLTWVVVSGKVDLVTTAVDIREPTQLLANLRESAADPSKAEQVRDDLARLDRIVWRPVAARLTGVPTLVFVPDKALHLLPFAALLDEATGRYLIQSHEVVVSPSATIYLRALERQRQLPRAGSPSLLAVGDPSFDRTNYPSLPRLARASSEVDRIAELYPASFVLKKETATKAAFLDGLERFTIVHYAGHALGHDVDSLRSRLILAPDVRAGSDGTLFAEEIYGRRFTRTRLVVLAACSTAAGLISRGEGAMSLARPFLAAGVPAVIASLWDIEDRAGSELSLRLHRRLSKGDAPQEALRAAQLEMIASPDPALSSPGAWAAFEMIGGSSPGGTVAIGREGT